MNIVIFGNEQLETDAHICKRLRPEFKSDQSAMILRVFSFCFLSFIIDRFFDSEKLHREILCGLGLDKLA